MSARHITPVRLISMISHTPLITLALSALSLTACGGGGGGGGAPFTPPQPTGGSTQRATGSTGGEAPSAPKKPTIKRNAKELFLEAGRVASEGPSSYPRAIEMYERAYSEEPNLKQALYNIALLHERSGDQAQAVGAYKRATDNGAAEGWVGIGLMQLAANNMGEAELSFRKALEMEPLNGRAHLNLALIAKERGDHKEAMGSIRNALKEDSTNANAYNLLAQIYHDMGRFKLALLVCDAGLGELAPEHSGLWTTQGLIHLKLKDVIKATASFRQAIKFDTTNFAARLNLGLITFNYRDYERSYQLLSEAVQLKPEHPEALLSKAVAARALDRIDEARQAYQQVLSLKPNHPGALFNLAILQQDYTQIEGFDARINNLREVIKQYENVLNFTQDERLRKKIVQRVEEARIMIEALEVEKEMAAAQGAQAPTAP